MTTRLSEIAPEPEISTDLEVMPDGSLVVHDTVDIPGIGVVSASTTFPKWTECEFEDCTNPTSFQMRDRFGVMHKACTDHQETLDRWVRIHNGWEEAETGEEGAEEGVT